MRPIVVIISAKGGPLIRNISQFINMQKQSLFFGDKALLTHPFMIVALLTTPVFLQTAGKSGIL